MKDGFSVTAMEVGGVRINAMDLRQAGDEVITGAKERRGAAVHLCNAYTVSLAQTDENFRSLLNRSEFNFPDGMPLVWVARRVGIALSDRVYGPDLMIDVLDRGRAAGLRHFLYGATDDVLKDLEHQLVKRLPGAVIAGKLAPPFRELGAADDDEVVRAVSSSDANVVWVGLGTPKQDYCVDRLRSRLDVPLVAVGAAFNFHTGRVRQAPRLVQRAGMEWAFRLVMEPRRLWKRYLVGNSRFVWSVIRHRPRILK